MWKNRYRYVISYDGTFYYGWQEQKDLPTIVAALRSTFKRVFDQDAKFFGVSRTDAGVHALGQVGILQTDIQVNPKKMMYALNNLLPEDISISCVDQVPVSFNLHADIESKTYHYHFFTQKPNPLVQRYGWYIYRPIDLQKLQDCLCVFVGTHDFRSFSTGDERDGDTVRTIQSIDLSFDVSLGAHKIIVCGPKFLHHMVRRIVGACLSAASSCAITPAFLQKMLQLCSPKTTLPTAPAKGLLLYEVRYKNNKTV